MIALTSCVRVFPSLFITDSPGCNYVFRLTRSVPIVFSGFAQKSNYTSWTFPAVLWDLLAFGGVMLLRLDSLIRFTLQGSGASL